MLAPLLPPVHQAGAGPLAAAQGPRERTVEGRARPIDLVGGVQLGQEDLAELLPDPGGLPVAEPSPAGHAAAAAHLQRQELPRDAGLEDEEDAGQRLAIVEGLATRESEPPWLGRRQQRLDPFPEFIG